jgi:formylglycine-generating enzyme required for sulfatase activity
MSSDYQWLLEACGKSGDSREMFSLANQLRDDGDLHKAATAMDRAFGLAPSDAEIRTARSQLLDQLAVSDLGVSFRYIPAGTFLMGSEYGDSDEKPVHAVQLDHFWISETPISWAVFCRHMNWESPPSGMPKGEIKQGNKFDKELFWLSNLNKVRLQYCEDETQQAKKDWHAHLPEHNWKRGDELVSSRKLLGEPQRGDPSRPWAYEKKPMVCVRWEDVEKLCRTITSRDGSASPPGLFASYFRRRKAEPSKVQFRLPTEAEWEKAARGGLIGCKYSWGDDPPTHECCDFNRFDEFSILPSRRFASNDYGLYAMCGGVWEWTSDWYDAEFYREGRLENPLGPTEAKQKVARGGSWADTAEVVTVSFRMSMSDDQPPHAANPNIGFRLCRVESGA